MSTDRWTGKQNGPYPQDGTLISPFSHEKEGCSVLQCVGT